MTAIHDSGERARTPAFISRADDLETRVHSAILDATGCLILAVELGSGLVVAVNATVETVSGQPREELLGRPLWELAGPPHDALLRSAFTPADGAGIPRVYEANVATGSVGGFDGNRVLWSSEFITDLTGARSHVVLTGIVVSGEKAPMGMVNHMLRAATAAALVGTDRSGRVTFCSSGAEQMLGFTAAELMGRHFPRTVFEPEQLEERGRALGLPADLGLLTADLSGVDRRTRRAPGLGHLERRARGGRTRMPELRRASAELQQRDWTLISKNGDRITAAVSVSPVTDRDGNHIGFLGIAHDVTEQRTTQELLLKALETETAVLTRMRAVDQAKSDFVSTVSHELRTPVTSMTGYTELLEDGLAGALTPEQLKLLGAVRRNGERLTALVDDLLALASAREGTLVTERAELDLRTVFLAAEEMLSPLLMRRRLEISFELPDDPVNVSGDATQLERVLLDLLSNAVKFTEDGGRISCSLRSLGKDAVIEVTDTGIGIPAEEQDGIFTSFFRTSGAQQRAIQGSGLGLSIAAGIVEAHGGDIAVTSEHLRGSTFTVRLPASSTHSSEQLNDG